MHRKVFCIERVAEGKNSVLFHTASTVVLYEKLSNTIHSGDRKLLENLQKEVESIEYAPMYESETLREKKREPMGGLVLNVTESCNFSCTYCINSGAYHNERQINPSMMEFNIARRAVDLFIPFAEDPALISFYGGEPLCNISLIERVMEYTRHAYPSKGIRFSMTTNFYDADKHFKTIVGGDMYVLVSLDGPKEIHDKYRRSRSGGTTWEKITCNLKMLDRFSPGYVESHIGLSVTCVDPNEILDIANYFENKGKYFVFRIGAIETKGLKNTPAVVSKPPQTYELASEFLDCVIQKRPIPDILRLLFDDKLRIIAQRNRERMPEQIMLLGACYPGKRKLFVDTDGMLYICEKFGGRKPIGDVKTGIRQDLVDKIIDEFERIRNTQCTNTCWAQRLCTPCEHSAKDSKRGISTRGLSQTCNSSKQELLMSLALYAEIIKGNKEFLESYTIT